MKNAWNRLALAAALLAGSLGPAQAVTLALQGPSALTAQPGATVGWGFSIQADATEWISFIGSLLLDESTPALGSYTDFIGQRGGPVDYALPPAAGTWLQFYDAGTLQGLGSYTLDLYATPGASNPATLRVLYERYSGNPLQCGSTCWLGGSHADLTVSVTAAPVPELPPQALLAAGLVAVAWLRRSRVAARARAASLPKRCRGWPAPALSDSGCHRSIQR